MVESRNDNSCRRNSLGSAGSMRRASARSVSGPVAMATNSPAQGSADRLLGSFRHRHAGDLTQLQQTQIVAANLLNRNVSGSRRDAN